ncbi:hypothetical protein [Sphingobium sp. LF-16]|uniref:hypothetical protein n=1 Tax=Sphingobium sp. LF-16 TaxID=2185111 RepID=UPI000F0781D4|nr:hypothetical protein [Sphingobium sp. LF-16]
MTDWAAEAARLHAAFADPILYTGSGLVEESITGTKCDQSGDAFQGAGATIRHVWFEVQMADFPNAPGKGDRIVHTDRMTGATTEWEVIDRVDRADIGAWELTVEEA